MLTLKVRYPRGAEAVIACESVEYVPGEQPDLSDRVLVVFGGQGIYAEGGSAGSIINHPTKGDVGLSDPSYISVWVMNEHGKTVADYRI